MRCLIIGLNYLPESTSIGPYTSDLAEYLLSCGHTVRVVTSFPTAPQWKIWDGYDSRLFMREVIHGVPVQRTFLYVPVQPKKAINRILFDLSFAFSSLLGGLLSGKADIVIVVSPPLELGLTGLVLAKLKRAPLFFHIQDLVPDAAIATGVLNERGWAIRLARYLERFIYRHADAIGVISDGFTRNLVAKGVPVNKVALLPNYIDLRFVKTGERNNRFRHQHGIAEDKFLVMYSGSVALKQGLQTFVEAAAVLRAREEITFYLVGEGPCLKDLKAIAVAQKLTRMQFLSLQPRESLPIQLAAADALVVTQRKTVTDVVFPGKLLYYMAASRPIIAAVNADSETGRFVSDHQVGLVVPPEDPKALAEAIQYLQTNRTEVVRLGQNGRQVVEQMFDHKLVLSHFTEHLEALVHKTKRDK
jgi:colanic acid biosynthesis glycosyl transferase WcaI